MLRKICFIEVVCHYCCRIFLFSCRSNIILEAPKGVNPRDYTLLRNAKIMLLFFFSFGTDATVCPDSLSQHNNFDFGIWERGPADRVQKRGVGWWYDEDRENAVHSNLNGIYPLCGSETAADIHWGHLAPKRGAVGSAPKSSEMKIRPVDFF